MNTKHNTYLDLSKLSEEEIKEIKDLTYGYVDKISKYPLLFWDEIEWNQAEKDDQNYIPNLTEISLEEWKSMIEGTSEGTGRTTTLEAENKELREMLQDCIQILKVADVEENMIETYGNTLMNGEELLNKER